MLISAFREVSLARRDLGWGVDALAMRLTMLGFLRHGRKNNASDSGIPQEATLIDRNQGWLDGRASEWQRFLRWAHASYGWTEEVIVKRAGFAPGELEVVALSSGKSRNRPMAPTYVLAVDHGRREIVLSVRGTKAFGDAITITHFRPEPFLDGYAHRGFAQSAHELVKQVEPELTSLAERLPDYRVCFTGHSMGGGIAAMASMLIRDSATRRLQQQQHQHQHGHQGEEPPSTARKRASSSTNLDHRGSRKRRGTAAGGGKISAGAGLGGSGGPEVYSFATPSCVSLELARGCEGWVDSVVHGDDAIPRLSTVSLELLKEDMTAAEWRRAVDRLTDLNTVLSPSTKAAAAAATAIKNALTGLGARRGVQRPASSAGGGGGSGDDGRTNHSAAADSIHGGGDGDGSGGCERANRGEADGGGGGGGGGDAEFVSSLEGWREESSTPPPSGARVRSAPAAAATAAAEPKVTRRQGPASAAAPYRAAGGTAEEALPTREVRKGETDRYAGDSGGGSKDGAEPERNDEEKKRDNDRKRDDLGRSVRDTALTMRGLAKLYPLSQSFRQEIATIVTQVVKLTGGETGEGAGAIKPKERRVRRAENNSGSGGRSGDLQRQQAEQAGTGTNGGDVRNSGGSAAAGARARGGGAEAESPVGTELLLTLKENLESLGASRGALKQDNAALGGGGGGSGSGGGSGGSGRVRNGDENRSGGRRRQHQPSASAAGGSAAAASLATRGPGAAVTKSRGSDVTAATDRDANVGADDDRLRCLHEAFSARPEPSLLPLYPPGGTPIAASDAATAATTGSCSEERDGSGQASGDTQQMVTTTTGASAAAAAAGEDGVVLMRVPHEHFLRMPLSPTMLEDHSILSYRKALAGLSRNPSTGRLGQPE
ncbi:conserved unknown protein [Ectocarpus siliculosus]|uniref:Fungal lipase-type domain-containing protein n=1 Tax=Ectocarpus siliculosus TaxID=2880 RepID=D7G2N6_ECTSI|nr:conserved unknown protein [Ectocarpus siliculosus]|eukprot:CBJ26861.1 conserved unknown protein [Ectocarpus siliculosus]